MAELLRLESATFCYQPPAKILNNLYLALNEGEIVAVVGRNGCGKTTLFKSLTNAAPDSGTMFFRDHFLEPAQRCRHIAIMAQHNFLPDDLNVEWILKRWIRPSSLWAQCHDDPLLDKIAGKRFGMLSGGEKRYLEFLVTLGFDRPVTILDEPFSEMAPLYSAAMSALLRRLAPGRAFLISDHDWHSVWAVATRLELMRNGRLHSADTEEELRRLGYLPERATPPT